MTEVTPATACELATTPEKAENLVTNLADARSSIGRAVESLRLAYNVKNPTGKSHEDFVRIRGEIKDSAEMFRGKVWPLSNDFVRSLKDFLEEFYGPTVDFKDWLDDIDDATKAAKVKAGVSLSIVQMYKQLGREFGEQKNPIAQLLERFQAEIEVLNEKMEKFETDIAGNKEKSESWGSIPVLGAVLEIVFEWDATVKADKLKLWNTIQDQNQVLLGIEAIQSGLAPAIEHFGNAMLGLAGFFHVMYRDLNSISDKPEEVKKRHFKFFQERVRGIADKVDAFNAIEAAVCVKLACLPDPKSQEAMEKAARTWFQKLIDESKETKPVLESMKEAFQKSANIFKAVKDFPDSALSSLAEGSSSADAGESPTRRAGNE